MEKHYDQMNPRNMTCYISKPDELIRSLNNPDKSEDQRFHNLHEAIKWVIQELTDFKNQDQALMRQFKDLRVEINRVKEEGLPCHTGRVRQSSLMELSSATDKEFDGVHECNLSPFDAGEMVAMRRRAFSSVERVRKFSLKRKISADESDCYDGYLQRQVTKEESELKLC